MYINKTLIIYPSFVLFFLLVGAVFLTSTTYTQLGIAVMLYPLLAFFGYKIFLGHDATLTTVSKSHLDNIPAKEVIKEQDSTQTDSVGIADIDKRAFLKLIGATGISFFVMSIFGQKIQSLLFGQNGPTQPGALNVSPQSNSTASASPTDSYSISEVDNSTVSYFGFIDKEGGWFIMQGNADTGSYRYTKGTSNFPSNWKRRQALKYDYFYKVFP